MHKTPSQIDCDDPIPIILNNVGCGPNRLLDPRVVERDVESPKRFDRPVQSCLHVLTVCHITLDGECATIEVLDQTSRLLVARFGNVGDHHASALARERLCCRATNAARSAGNGCDFVLKR